MTSRHGPRSRGAAAAILRTPRRVFSAFALGMALSVAGLAALAAGVAGARGNFIPPDMSAFAESAPSQSSKIAIVRYSGPSHSRQDDDDRRSRRRPSSLRASVTNYSGAGRDPVCVRLCDGYFFPMPSPASDAVSQGAACNSLCPNAPTEVYYRDGAERIEDSVSASGKRYSALPVSLRYRTTSNDTCSCHRDAVAYAPLGDVTLRRGDAIMTPAGFVVFRGVEHAPHRSADFTALDSAGLGSGARGALQAMERASLAPAHPTLKSWLLSQNAAPPLPQAVARTSTQIALHAAAPVVTAAQGDGKIRLLTWRGQDE